MKTHLDTPTKIIPIAIIYLFPSLCKNIDTNSCIGKQKILSLQRIQSPGNGIPYKKKRE